MKRTNKPSKPARRPHNGYWITDAGRRALAESDGEANANAPADQPVGEFWITPAGRQALREVSE